MRTELRDRRQRGHGRGGRSPVARRRAAAAAALGLVVAAAATACGYPVDAHDDGRLSVVASTPVWAGIAAQVAGPGAEVLSIVPAGQDPHEFQAAPTDALHVSRADLLVSNGGGYDGFFDTLVRGVSSSAPTVNAYALHATAGHDSHDDDHADEAHGDEEHGDGAHDEEHGHGGHGHGHGAANEHVWFDLGTVGAVADAVAGRLAQIAPADADGFRARAAALRHRLDRLGGQAAAIAATHPRPVVSTEPVAYYLLHSAGIEDLTPPEFGEAVEHGSDPAPAVIARLRSLLTGGEVAALIRNVQTESPTTEVVRHDAKDAGLPVVDVGESPPDGTPYTDWVGGILTALGKATAR